MGRRLTCLRDVGLCSRYGDCTGGQVDVRCATCQREESWETAEDGRATVRVLSDGGLRRPSEHAQWVRGRTALAAFAGETGPVVGVCEGCGQLLLAVDPVVRGGASGLPVRVDTPAGALQIGAEVIGPEGPLSREQAERFLAKQYRRPMWDGWAEDLHRLPFFLFFAGPLIFLLMSGLAMWTFFAALIQGPADPVSGPVDWNSP